MLEIPKILKRNTSLKVSMVLMQWPKNTDFCISQFNWI